MLTSAFYSRFKANYLEKIRGYPHFSLWIPIALNKILPLQEQVIQDTNLFALLKMTQNQVS